MKEPDGTRIGDYDTSITDSIIAEAADIFRSSGFTRSHMVIIGGLVPTLLVPVLDPWGEPHIGTADIDLCLSVALIEGETEEYERLENTLKTLGFEIGDVSFRWTRSRGLKITLEFFCPSGPNRPAGHTYRPSKEANPTAKHNMGGKLSALSLDAGDLLNDDVEIIKRSVTLPGGKGNTEMELRVTGPIAFLIAKSEALNNRDKPKDAYDIIWLIENWPGGPAAAAQAFAKRSVYSPHVEHQLQAIGSQFADEESVGSRSYARFTTEPGGELLAARRAVGAATEFLRDLPAVSTTSEQ